MSVNGFKDIRGLVQSNFRDGKQYGPLDPFPGPAPPAPSKQCSPDDIPDPEDPEDPRDPDGPENPEDPPPAASSPVAAAAQITAVQRVGASTVLSGSNTAQGIPSSDLVFSWTKTSPASPSVSIQNAAQPTATLTAPKVTIETIFVFELKVSLKSDSRKSSKANVTVKVNPAKEDTVTLDTYTWVSRQSGTLSVTCHSNVVNNAATKYNMAPGSRPSKWTYTSRDRNRPTNVQCVSDLNGKSALVTSTTSRRRRGELGVDLTSPAEWLEMSGS
jgi:hypothetical protein